jgi:hypothetical protein
MSNIITSSGNILGPPTDGFFDPIIISKVIRLTGGPGAIAENLLQYTGAIQILDQYAQIIAITTLVNLTDVRASLWDGTNEVPLTKTPGAVLSGFTVESFFLKDKTAGDAYTTMNADQNRLNENSSGVKAGRTFIANPKFGVDNFIRFFANTTDAPVDFMMKVYFEYQRLTDNANLVFL